MENTDSFSVGELYWIWRKFQFNEHAAQILADFMASSKAEARALTKIFESTDERKYL